MDNKLKTTFEEIKEKASPAIPTKKTGEFVNLTPHDIKVILPDDSIKIYKKSGIIARVTSNISAPYIISGVPVYQQLYGEIQNLPEPKSGIYFIVSAIVKTTYDKEVNIGKQIDRFDLVVPSNFVRDAEGIILGCKSFIR